MNPFKRQASSKHLTAGTQRGPGEPRDVHADLRELIFADEPLERVATYAAEQDTDAESSWKRLAEVAALVREDHAALAIPALYRILEDAGDDSRDVFQVWNYLRQLGEVPAPEVARRILGLVIERSLQDSQEILAAYWDGKARHLNARKDYHLFESPAPFMVAAIRRFLRTSRPLVETTLPSSAPRAAPPSGGRCRISVLTPAGLHVCEDTWDALWSSDVGGPILGEAGWMTHRLIQAARSTGLWKREVAPWPTREGQDGGPPRVH